jgi:predicted HNH restriction endonuclease
MSATRRRVLYVSPTGAEPVLCSFDFEEFYGLIGRGYICGQLIPTPFVSC